MSVSTVSDGTSRAGTVHSVRLVCRRPIEGVRPASEIRDGEVVTIGGDPGCEIVVPCEGIAATHCTIQIAEGTAILSALNPLTWINDGPVQKSGVLTHGDRLTIGPVEFDVELVKVQRGEHAESRPNDDLRMGAPADVIDPVASLSADERTNAIARAFSRRFRDDSGRRRRELLEEAQAVASLRSELARLSEEIRAQKERAGKSPEVASEPSLTSSADRDAQVGASLAEANQNGESEERAVGTDTGEEAERLRVERARIEELSSELQAEQEEWEARVTAQLGDLVSREERLAERERSLDAQAAELDRRQEAVQRDLAACEAQIQEIETRGRELAEREERLAGREQEVGRTLEELRAQRDQLERIEQELSDERDQVRTRQESLASQIEEVEDRAGQLAVGLQCIHQQREELAELRGELEQLQEELKGRQAALAEHDCSLQAREEAVARREEELQRQRRGFEEERREFESAAAARQSELDGRAATLEEAIADFKANRAQLEEDRRKLTEASERLEAERTNLAEAERKLVQEREELTAVQEEHAVSRQQLDTDLSHLERERQAVAEDSAALVQQREELLRKEEELQRRENEIESRLVEARGLDTLRDELEAQRIRMTEDAEALAAERSELEQQRIRFEEERQQLEQSTAELLQRQEQCAAREQELADVHSAEESAATDALRSELDEERTRLEEERGEVEALRDRLHQQCEELDRRIAAFEARQQEEAASVAELQELEDRLTAREQELAEREQALAQQEASLESSEESSDGLVNGSVPSAERIRELEEEIAALREELAEARLAGDSQTGESANIAAVDVEEVERLRAELDELREELAATQGARKTLLTSLETLGSSESEILSNAAELSREWQLVDAQRQEIEAEWAELRDERSRIESAWADLEVDQKATTLEREELHRLRDQLTRERERLDLEIARWTTSENGRLPDEDERGDEAEAEASAKEDAAEEQGDSDTAGSIMPGTYLQFLEELHGEDSSEADADPLPEQPAIASVPAQEKSEPLPEPCSGEGNRLRSELAALFGLPEGSLDELSRRQEQSPQTGSAAPTSASTSESRSDEPTVPSAGVRGIEPSTSEEEEDPVAAYMQQLLNRCRRPESEGDSAQASALQSTVVTKPVTTALPQVSHEASEMPSGETQEEPKRRPRPRLGEEELNELRSNIDSMREVANISARQAVAKHRTRQLITLCRTKQVVFLMCLAFGVIAFTAELWGHETYRQQGAIGMGLSMIVGLDLLRTRRQAKKMKELVSYATNPSALESGEADA